MVVEHCRVPFGRRALVVQQHVRQVLSADGTGIGYFTSGDGSPLLLVHGSIGDHTRWDQLRPLLETSFTVHAMDRRGRGASGDSPHYGIEREYEDLAAVIDDIAESSGSAVDVYCSSYGGLCAFGAARKTSNIRRLALYEAWPPVNPEEMAPASGIVEQMETLLAEENREAVLELVFREFVGLSDEEVATVRQQSSWPARVAAAHTIPREERAFGRTKFRASEAAIITMPTLLMIGSESPIWGPQAATVAAAMPDARIAVLEGQGHAADVFAPALVAKTLLPFLLER